MRSRGRGGGEDAGMQGSFIRMGWQSLALPEVEGGAPE
jgi:hypothetical protein